MDPLSDFRGGLAYPCQILETTMPGPTASPRHCSQCTDHAGLGVLEWARTTWWRRLARRPAVVVLHVHVYDEAALDTELRKLVHQSMQQYSPYPR